MSPEDIARAFKLAEDWFEEKARTGIPQDESLWSRSLLKLTRPDPPHSLNHGPEGLVLKQAHL
jgi:hypothetical protein